MQFTIEDQCNGENKCDFEFDILKFHSGVKGATEQCNQDSYFFFQAPCLIPKNQMKIRRIIGLFIACFAAFCYFFSVIMIQYIE